MDAPGVRVVVRDLTVKQIGQLLGRSVGTPINGLVIERAGHELRVCLWRVGPVDMPCSRCVRCQATEPVIPLTRDKRLARPP